MEDAAKRLPLSRALVAVTGALAAASCVAFSIFWNLTGQPDWTLWAFIAGAAVAAGAVVAVWLLKGIARSAVLAVAGVALIVGCFLLLWHPAAIVAAKFLGVASPALLVAAAFAVVASGALRARAARPGLVVAGIVASVASGAGILLLVALATAQHWSAGPLLPPGQFLLGLKSWTTIAGLALFAGALAALVVGAISGTGRDRGAATSWVAVALGRAAFWGLPLVVSADALISASGPAELKAAGICVALALPLVWTAGYWTSAGIASLLVDVDDYRARRAAADVSMGELVRRLEAKEITGEEFRAQRDALPVGRTYAVGTLRYTTFGLVLVFVYLCWGDFVFTLLDEQLPNIMPLKLKDIGASDTTIMVLNRTLSSLIGFLLCPAVSFHSDRYRSRWGRRIPYLLWTTPLVGLFMVLIGCYSGVTHWFLGDRETMMLFGIHFSKVAVTIGVFAILYVGFDLANVFVGSVWYYLYNDVVPSEFLSRIFAIFRMIGIIAGMIYNKFIFPVSLEHFQEVFVYGGIAYGVGYMLMCVLIKEGKYPPPPENVDKRSGFFSSVTTFFHECFTHRFYWYFFLMGTFEWLSWQSGVFSMLRNRDSLHLNLQQLGDIAFYIAPVSFILQYPTGWLADKYHPVRVYYYLTFICCLNSLTQSIFIFTDFGPHGNLVFLYGLSLAFLPFNSLRSAASYPLYMKLLPKDRYGQFCSANAMVRSAAMIGGTLLAAVYMECIGLIPASDYFIGTAGIDVKAERRAEPAWTEEAVGPWTVAYPNNRDENATVTVPGAAAVRVFFSEIITEAAWDHLRTDAAHPDDFTGAFDDAWSGAKPGDAMTLRVTSGQYMTLGGDIVLRDAANLRREGVKTARFTVTKVAYLGARTGPVAISGPLVAPRDPSRFELSGVVVRAWTEKGERKTAPVRGVTVAFSSDNPAGAPRAVVTDAGGRWWQDGFDNGARYRVAFERKEMDGTWTFEPPKGPFAREAGGIETEGKRAASPGTEWRTIEVGDAPERGEWMSQARGELVLAGLAREEKLEPWRVEYGNDWDRAGSITVPGAKAVKVMLEDVRVEPGWDRLSTDADVPDAWTGDFAADNTSVKSGDTISFRVTSGHYVRSQGTLFLRLSSNMMGARFRIGKIAYLGEKTGPVTRSGELWKKDEAWSLSGRVFRRSGGAGIPGVTVSFERSSGAGETPAPVVTDAAGNWSRAGFAPGTHYKVSASQAPSVSAEPPWAFGRSTIGDWRYRYYTLWVVFFNIFMLLFLVLLYREWKKLGGAESYVPPAA